MHVVAKKADTMYVLVPKPRWGNAQQQSSSEGRLNYLYIPQLVGTYLARTNTVLSFLVHQTPLGPAQVRFESRSQGPFLLTAALYIHVAKVLLVLNCYPFFIEKLPWLTVPNRQ